MFLDSIETTTPVANLQPAVQTVEVGNNYGYFQIEPLGRGLGHTLGNPLRRVLLSSLPGAAVTTARIDGVLHEFSTVEFMQEDLVEFLLNVKRIRVRSFEPESAVCYLEKAGPGVITAGDIEAPSGVEIVNPDHYLGTLTEEGALRAEFTVEQGVGYARSEDHPSLPIGVIPLDAIFGPITKVEYDVEQAGVGQETEFDRLVVKIWTDGTTAPQDALRAAAKQLADMFGMVAGIDELPSIGAGEVAEAAAEAPGEPLEDLKLSNRAMNCLKRHGVETIQEVATMTEDDLYGLRGMGVRLVEEIRDALGSRGLNLAGTSTPEEAD